MAERTLTLRELNRATLARQLLLPRQRRPARVPSGVAAGGIAVQGAAVRGTPALDSAVQSAAVLDTPVRDAAILDAVRRIAGLQSQSSRAAAVGLWTRLPALRRERIADLMQRRLLVKGSLMRVTQHLVTAADYLVLRPALQPTLTRWAEGMLRRRAPAVELARLAAAARPFFDEPHSATELRAFLEGLRLEADVAAMALAVQIHLPLLQVPMPAAVWGVPGNPKFVNADTWLGRAIPEARGPRELITRYLAAFGPARVADIQAWSGVSRLGEEVSRLRPELRIFRDERGRELVDLPGAPIPPAGRAAPPRLVPAWDETLLAYADRSRIVPPEFHVPVYAANRLIGPAVLVDGLVAALWAIEKEPGGVTVVIRPLAPLPGEAREALALEGERLAGFAEPEAAVLGVRFADG